MTRRPRPLAIAHRAGNSLAALRAAEATGAPVVEADVWLYRGRLEVRHSKTLGPLPFRWDRWLVERATPPLRLAELLAAARPATGFMLDLKGRDLRTAAAVSDAIAPYVGSRTLIVCGQNWDLLRPFAGQPGVTVAHSIGREHQLDRVWPLLEAVENDAVSIDVRLLDAALVGRLRRVVGFVASWPINTARLLEQARAWALDAVITDSPAIIAALAGNPPAEPPAPGAP
jgi:glycerophosphoryl diester phosphodiesterase